MPGTELAIGGGNPLAHPDLVWFLREMKSLGVICNVTVNMLHMKKFVTLIKQLQNEKLIHGLGISYRGPKSLNLLPTDIDYSNVVFHMIMGINNFKDCRAVIDWCTKRNNTPKMLLLGYKTFGNGITCYTDELKQVLEMWKQIYLRLLLSSREKAVVSFDNLAISQLELQSQLDDETWNTLFQGHDGLSTFYIDAVKQEVARTSTSAERHKINKTDNIKTLFNKVKL
jgi:hypothetical protein